jgi:hypothetical protein
VLGGHRADHDIVAVAADAFQAGDSVQIDQMFGGCQPKLHHRNQAVTTGKGAGFVAQGREQFDRVGERRRPVIAERARNHRFLHASLCFGAYSSRKTANSTFAEYAPFWRVFFSQNRKLHFCGIRA